MNIQLLAIAIYNHEGDVRSLKLAPGRVNVITGEPKSGKTALIDIVDYCLGRETYTIKEGVIRESVAWYAIHILVPTGQAVIARPALEGNESSRLVFLRSGAELSLPEFSSLQANTNTDALEAFLTEVAGIERNERGAEFGRASSSLQATIKHARLLLYLPQYVIASPKTLFFRQDEPFVARDISDTLPYFLGATGTKQYGKLNRLRMLRRDLRGLRRREAEAAAVRGHGDTRARALLDEARTVGLPVEIARGIDDTESIISSLKTLEGWSWGGAEDLPDSPLVELEREKHLLSVEAQRLREDINQARDFVSLESDYSIEATDQKNRLSSINLYKDSPDEPTCPLCETHIQSRIPAVSAIRERLHALGKAMESTVRQRPHLDSFIVERERRLSELRDRMSSVKESIASVVAREDELRQRRAQSMAQAKVVGRISLFLESFLTVATKDDLPARIREISVEVQELEEDLSLDEVGERLDTALRLIGDDLTQWARHLELEHSEGAVSLDLRRLTVLSDKTSGKVRLENMGSGENWMGYHVITLLALHKYFVEMERPVPGFLMLDQPTQVYYPSDASDHSTEELTDKDRESVRRLFRLIFDVVDELSPNLQVILTDHADLAVGWFQDAVVEKWRGGNRLVPGSWYER